MPSFHQPVIPFSICHFYMNVSTRIPVHSNIQMISTEVPIIVGILRILIESHIIRQHIKGFN